MTFRTWVERFKPIKNPFDDNAAVDGYLFQPYGLEWGFINKQPSEHVWTLIITDLGRRTVWSIAEGFHIVNRHGYLVTGVPLEPGSLFDIRY